jgi:hypothetical protein
MLPGASNRRDRNVKLIAMALALLVYSMPDCEQYMHEIVPGGMSRQ